MCMDSSRMFTTMTATMISPTFCSRSSMLFTFSQSGFLILGPRCLSLLLPLTRNSSYDPRPNTRHTMPSRNLSRVPTADPTSSAGWLFMNADTEWYSTSFNPMENSSPLRISVATTPSMTKQRAHTSEPLTNVYSTFSIQVSCANVSGVEGSDPAPAPAPAPPARSCCCDCRKRSNGVVGVVICDDGSPSENEPDWSTRAATERRVLAEEEEEGERVRRRRAPTRRPTPLSTAPPLPPLPTPLLTPGAGRVEATIGCLRGCTREMRRE
mmetsp:Transcript_15808/g.38497  ORF Transcript_15808/g.38497 Transcript_15808/m.38497 type:complete len:268 (+) Transcript_15808:508-1311(+)